jgi:bifunctional ADP-heptose synthase (sugar kinase/adenylyltransferase)
MLLALRVVDYVHIFDEPDPIAFLNELRPDVHVNGSEYGENCIERDVVLNGGGSIYIVARLPELSTSQLVSALLAPVANDPVMSSTGLPLHEGTFVDTPGHLRLT